MLEAKLVFNPLGVGVNGFGAQIQTFGNDCRHEALADQIENLKFPVGQNADGRAGNDSRTSLVLVEDLCRHFFTQIDIAGEYTANRPDNGLRGFLFIDVAPRAGMQAALGIYLLIVSGQDQNRQMLVPGTDLLEQIQAVACFQRQIQYQKIRTTAGYGLERAIDIFRTAAYFQVGFLLDQVGEPHPKNRMILNDKNAPACMAFMPVHKQFPFACCLG